MYATFNSIEYQSDDVIHICFLSFHLLTTRSERAPYSRHVLTILGEWCQNGMKYGHLMAEDFPYKPLYFWPGSQLLDPGSKYSDLRGTMSAFKYLYLGHYFSDLAEICH